MMNASSDGPGARLELGYPTLTLLRFGAPIATARFGEPGFARDLRALGAAANRFGPVTVVLPEAEVWRGRLALSRRFGTTRRAEARRALATVLDSAAPQEIALGTADGASGFTPAAAAPRTVIEETRRLLRSAGVRRAVIIGAGDFPGFDRAPQLGRHHRTDFRSAAAPGARIAVAAGAAACTVAIGVFGTAENRPQPAPQIPVAVQTAPPVAQAPVAPPVMEAAIAASPAPRRPRAVAFERIALRATPPSRPAISVAEAPMVMVARSSRNLEGLGEVELAALTTADAPPRQRPPAATPAEGPIASGGDRPLARPFDRMVAALLDATPAAAAAADRPRARGETPAAPRELGGIAQDIAPLSRPARAAGTPVASLAPAPAPQATQPQTAAPRTAATPAAAQPAAAPVVRRVAATPPAQPAPPQAASPAVQQRAPAAATPAATPRGATLIGVFGPTTGRHALVRLQDGSIQRVRSGQTIGAATVTAVDADSVRLRSAGGEAILRLPR